MDLSAIPLYDHHAHALFREATWRQAPLEPYFSEANDPTQLARFGRDTLTFRRGVRDLARFYGCAPTVEAVLGPGQRWLYAGLGLWVVAQARIRPSRIDGRPLTLLAVSVARTP